MHEEPLLGGKYRLIRQLGAGGMGSVWLAQQMHLHALVAIKLITKELAATPAGAQRFLHEARTAASLRSPHVVQILDFGVDAGTPFLVMELLEGESLAARLDREGRFRSLEHAERVLRQIARAVARTHDAGIVHRDLKPANIFLIQNEDEELVKLLDFGVAKTKVAPDATSPANNTRTGEFLGSPSYSSPEQLERSNMVDHRADIWSLGVIAYECLIGKAPFAADTVVGVVLAICSRELPIPSEHGPVPAGFDAWFARACARDVRRRFQSVREASTELRQVFAAACPSVLASREPLSNSPPPVARSESLTAPPRAILPRAQQRFELSPPPGSIEPPWPVPAPDPPPREPARGPMFVALLLLASLPAALFALRAFGSRGSLGVLTFDLKGAATHAPAPQAAAPGTLRVESDMPELQATIDGKPRSALAANPIELPPGEHVLRFSAGPRYEPLERRVVMTPGQVIDVGAVRLRVLHGIATIRAGENAGDAQIAVDQAGSVHPLPALPTRLEVDVEHPQTLVAERPGYIKFEQPLAFPDGQAERTFEVRLTAQPVTERADSGPASAALAGETRPATHAPRRGKEPNHVGSEARPIEGSLTLTAHVPSSVLLDGVPLGTTPLQNIAVPSGSHEVTFVHDQERNTESFELKPGEHKRVSADLEAVQRNMLGDTLDPQVVERTVRSHNASLRDGCWQRALRGRHPTDPTSARISAQISVESSGRVQSVVASGAPHAFPDLARCIEEDVRYWRFPSARAGTTVNASFAFVLE